MVANFASGWNCGTFFGVKCCSVVSTYCPTLVAFDLALNVFAPWLGTYISTLCIPFVDWIDRSLYRICRPTKGVLKTILIFILTTLRR